MKVYSQQAGLFLAVASRKQSCKYACEHVTAPCRCHSAIAGVVEEDLSLWCADSSIVSFQDDEGIMPLSKVQCLGKPVVVAIGSVACKFVHLFGVWSHDDVFRQLL